MSSLTILGRSRTDKILFTMVGGENAMMQEHFPVIALIIEAGDKIWWPPGGRLGTRDKKLATFPRTIRALQTAHALEHQALDVD